jgi:hypothetical protein
MKCDRLCINKSVSAKNKWHWDTGDHVNFAVYGQADMEDEE